MGTYDFGYSPAWAYGHLVPLTVFTLLTTLAVWRTWHRLVVLLLGTLATWALAAFLIVQAVLEPNRPLTLPTEAFLSGGRGEVVDLGAGSGRSSLMVLLGRPQSRVTALDIYRGCYGIDENTPDRIRANARAAGAESRLTVQVGDMRNARARCPTTASTARSAHMPSTTSAARASAVRSRRPIACCVPAASSC